MWPTDENRKAWEQRYGHREDAAYGLPDAVRERLPKIDGRHVLHLPCGTGEVAARLVELGALVTGVDPSGAKLEAARERAPGAAFFQAEVEELPLQLRRNRFALVYAGVGTLGSVRDLGTFVSAVTSALRKNGRLIVHDWHPVFLCVDPVDLRWRESYFSEGLWRVGQIVLALGASLELTEVEELPAESSARRDPRLPTYLLLGASKR